MTNFQNLLLALKNSEVEFILIGGMAATAHGSARLTEDLDILYSRSPANLSRVVAALQDFRPYLRGAPPGLPFRFDAETLRRGLNFTLTTTAGDIDLLAEITGGGHYEDLLPHCVQLSVYGALLKCLSLEQLIQVKRAAGRPKDLEAIAELELLRDERASAENPNSDS